MMITHQNSDHGAAGPGSQSNIETQKATVNGVQKKSVGTQRSSDIDEGSQSQSGHTVKS